MDFDGRPRTKTNGEKRKTKCFNGTVMVTRQNCEKHCNSVPNNIPKQMKIPQKVLKYIIKQLIFGVILDVRLQNGRCFPLISGVKFNVQVGYRSSVKLAEIFLFLDCQIKSYPQKINTYTLRNTPLFTKLVNNKKYFNNDLTFSRTDLIFS